MEIRPATADDRSAIWAVIGPIIRAGEAYALDRDMSEDAALAYWMAPDHSVFVALAEGSILGSYYLRRNQAGGGAHVCNAGFATAEAAWGRGVARRMGTHAIETATDRGFRLMQFNFVVASNERAVHLWQSLGFAIVGRLPDAFAHPGLGFVDAFVMVRRL